MEVIAVRNLHKIFRVQIRKKRLSGALASLFYAPGFEKAHLFGISPFLGIREGRHPAGEYTLTEDDIREERKFEDVIWRAHTIHGINMGAGKSPERPRLHR